MGGNKDMKFDPGIKIGDVVSNGEMRRIFQCGNMGGMRKSNKTGTLVVVSDDTKGLYKDVWKNGVLHYTGMGKKGDQTLTGANNQNGTLYYSDTNGVEVHLFEVLEKARYTYRGVVVLADKPYMSEQYDEIGNMRKVWMFPIKPVGETTFTESREPEEKELIKLTEEELARRSTIKVVDKKQRKTETVVYYRDPYVKELVKRIAKGKCQYCGQDAPFVDKNNVPYLEEHHVKRLADGGTDTIDNVVAICPNCHRKMHVLNDSNDMLFLEGVARNNESVMKRMLFYQSNIGKDKNEND